MAHKREISVRHNINDYVMMRVYGKRKFYLGQVSTKNIIICRIDLESREVVKTDKTVFHNSKEPNSSSQDIVVKNYGLRKNIDIVTLEQDHPELFLRLI